MYQRKDYNNNNILLQGKPLQCRNTVTNGDPVKLRWIKLRLILRREENPSKRRLGRDQLQQLYSHKFQVRQSARSYTLVVTHPVITPSAQA